MNEVAGKIAQYVGWLVSMIGIGFFAFTIFASFHRTPPVKDSLITYRDPTTAVVTYQKLERETGAAYSFDIKGWCTGSTDTKERSSKSETSESNPATP